MTRLWLVTGLMVDRRAAINTIVGGLVEARSESEALGLLLAGAQHQFPGRSANAFAASDCTSLVREFVERHPK